MVSPLLNSSVFAELLSDPSLQQQFSTESQLHRWLAFEIALTEALAATGHLDATVAAHAIERMRTFTPDVQAIAHATVTDGLPIPEFVRQLKVHAGDAVAAVHVGTTSQDLLDTAFGQALAASADIILKRLIDVLQRLDTMVESEGVNSLVGRTRMQMALPITVADRLSNWRSALDVERQRLQEQRQTVSCLQLGGPVGTAATRFGADSYPRIVQLMATSLLLQSPNKPWHTERQRFIEFGNGLSLLTGVLGKIGQDIVLMSQQGIDEIVLQGGGGSSAMPHKQNPIVAEKLVSIARFNAGQLASLHHAMVHEQERSGSAWVLEWMTLPTMVELAGRASADTLVLLNSIETMGSGAR